MLFFGDGEAEPLHHGEEINPDEPFQGEVLIMEEIAGVKGGANGNAVQLHPSSALAGNSIFLRPEKAFDGGCPEGDDDDGGDDRDLGAEIR